MRNADVDAANNTASNTHTLTLPPNLSLIGAGCIPGHVSSSSCSVASFCLLAFCSSCFACFAGVILVYYTVYPFCPLSQKSLHFSAASSSFWLSAALFLLFACHSASVVTQRYELCFILEGKVRLYIQHRAKLIVNQLS